MKKRTFIIFLVIVLVFIWGHSLIPTDNSTAESTGIMKILQSVFDFLNIPVTLDLHFVRKLAHLTEHAAAGLLLGLFMYRKLTGAESKRELIDYAAMPLVIGFFIGFIDETIQIFSGRGPLIQDVWIDFFGVFIGVLAAYLIIFIRFRRKRRKDEKEPVGSD